MIEFMTIGTVEDLTTGEITPLRVVDISTPEALAAVLDQFMA